jgi:hypothetical protein
MVKRSELGNVAFVASGAVDLLVLGGFGFYSSTTESIFMAAVLLTVPSFLVGYLTGEYGLVYGLILGMLPAISVLAVFPTALFGLSSLGEVVVLFVACVLLSGLSGAGGGYVSGMSNRTEV